MQCKKKKPKLISEIFLLTLGLYDKIFLFEDTIIKSCQKK